jgi:hypothetical protein
LKLQFARDRERSKTVVRRGKFAIKQTFENYGEKSFRLAWLGGNNKLKFEL